MVRRSQHANPQSAEHPFLAWGFTMLVPAYSTPSLPLAFWGKGQTSKGMRVGGRRVVARDHGK